MTRNTVRITILTRTAFCLVFRIERPILGDHNPKPHKFACSGLLPSSVTQAKNWLRNNVISGHQCVQTLASFNKANCKTYLGQD